MARIRSVHPGLWTDDRFVTLSMTARLFAIGLWNEADDYGLFEWKPVRLKMRIFPADAVDAEAMLHELVAAEQVVRIERAGRLLGVVRNFRKYQRPKAPSAPLVPVDREIIGIIGLDPDGPFPKGHRNTGEALPQSFPSPTEKPPQMEDGGGRKDSDADASEGGTAPGPDGRLALGDEPVTPTPSIASQIWKAGVPFLVNAGIREGPARSLLGKWRKGHGDEATLGALIRAEQQAVSEPVAWIEAALTRGGGQDGRIGGTGGHGVSQRERSRAAAFASLGP